MLHRTSEVIIIVEVSSSINTGGRFLTEIFANVKALNISGMIPFGFLMSKFRLDLIFTDCTLTALSERFFKKKN